VWTKVILTRTFVDSYEQGGTQTLDARFEVYSNSIATAGDVLDFDITDIQIEQKSYSTPFVVGSRGTTVATGGGLADLSGNNNHGELVNGVGSSIVNGGSLVFDGVNDYIATPLSGTYSQITYEFMGFFDDPSLNVTSRNESAFGDWVNLRVHFGTRWSVGMHWNVNNSWAAIPTTNLRYGWNHYTLVWDNISNSKKVYLNGILSHSTSTNGSIVMVDFRIGVATNLNAYYRGNIPIFKVYNRALNETEVLRNFNATKSRYNL
jgi:hypothetical protein